jgi:flavin-dependent dehydrogenase
MADNNHYDCAIIGGGVAGLALAILLAGQNRKVILFEKENYPFHKVCGEYISNESVKFIEKLGLDLSIFDPPQIDSLFLSSVSGLSLKRKLSIGGIGLSRYRLDYLLSQLALDCGVTVKVKTKVQQVEFKDDLFSLSFGHEQITARVVCGAYGKNSNLDVQLNRTIRAKGEKDLFIAVKHHLRIQYDPTRVEMHNFKGGYCGLSAIEDGKVNMSYITKARNLKDCGNKISELEKQVLSSNPFLERIISEATFELEKPLVISHLHFGLKTTVDEHLLMLGDAAGNIAPLSGNGISMALRSASIAHQLINSFLGQQISRQVMEMKYTQEYRKAFLSRISYARMIHRTFGLPIINDLSFCFLKLFPFMVDFTQTKIHGSEF